MTFDPSRFVSFDTETYKITPGIAAPRLVCGSYATEAGGALLGTRREVLDFARGLLEGDRVLVGANVAYDLAVLGAADDRLVPLIFKALDEERVYDILIAQALDAIEGGHLGSDPRSGSKLRHPSTNKPTKRYGLEVCVDLVLGRVDAKERDAWRTSYALLEGVPVEAWPPEAKQYPIDDAQNTLEVAVRQLSGWVRGAYDEETGPARNINNLPDQVRAAFALHLGACWGLRTSAEAVASLAVKTDKQHAAAVERYQKQGWVRGNGTGDQVAVRKAVAASYGAVGVCERCDGVGQIQRAVVKECRGDKIKGRFAGCTGALCAVCGGTGHFEVPGAKVVCKASEGGCDGTGLDLKTADKLPRTNKGGIAKDRDSVMEAGDDELAAFGENEFEKTRSTYLPWLRRGIEQPVNLRPNVLVATGRCSYEDPLHQMPRNGDVRECVVARPGYVLASTDYSAGELCTFSQYMHWVLVEDRAGWADFFGERPPSVDVCEMMETINRSGDPGALHSAIAAEVLGLPVEEVVRRVKAKDKQAVAFRQAAKPINFGVPGGMGVAKQVLTNRKKNAGSTTLPDGRVVAGIRFCVLIGGASECGTEKLTVWKGRPCAPVCKACCDIVEETLRPAYFKRFPEVKEYFRWVVLMTEKTGGKVPCLGWDGSGGVAVLRWRSGIDYSAACNNGFQAMLADIGKLAFYTIAREAYTGLTGDGEPSPLAGSRPIVFMHDEPICELPEETAHLAGPRIAEIMKWAGKKLAPDVAWVAETALARQLSKGMEPVYDEGGKLLVWAPKKAA